MTWYAFKGYNNNQAVDASTFDSAELSALGMHGYSTQAEAQAHPNSVNVFQAPVVNAAIDDANNARDVASAPGNAAAAVASAGTGTIDDAINFLKQSNIWERAAEIVAGLILLYVGVKAVATPTGQAPAQRSVKDTAKTIAEVAK